MYTDKHKDDNIALDEELVKALGFDGNLYKIAMAAGLNKETVKRSLDRGYFRFSTAAALADYYGTTVTALAKKNAYFNAFAIEFEAISKYLRENFPDRIANIYLATYN